MKQATLKFAVLGALGCMSGSVFAAFENLPTTGVSVGSDTSAYIMCNTTGDFGQGIVTKPANSSAPCAVVPATETTVPDSTYTGLSAVPIASATRNIVMNNTYTNNTNITIGTLREWVWRKSLGGGNYECIYATKVNLTNTDYNLNVAGAQHFEVNDLARGGWGSKTVDVAYSAIPSDADVVYRIGRTFTSVQHRSGSAGYVNQPLTGLGSSPSINGINAASGTPTANQQKADVDQNWINFTTDVNFNDDDGSSFPASGMFYVRTSCTSSAPTATANAIRLRQTFQELSGDGVTNNWFIEVPVTGYLPTGGSGSVTPNPTSPF